MTDGTRRWNTRQMTGRCKEWENRPVRDSRKSSLRRERIVQVRCIERAGHTGPHTWKGVEFGHWKATS